jgi:hypothetical protein
MRLRGLVVLLGLVTALSGQTTAPTLRVLFLGNSLTDGNNVPALVQAMAELQGVHLEFTAVAPGGYALEDHWHDNNQVLLADRHYDAIVLQQGPSTLPESQANLIQWATTWANEARRFGTEPALYMVWPVRTQAGGFGLVSQSYRNAAIAAHTAIFPAGEAWEQVLRADASIRLYSSDDLHATPAGSFLAAMVIARGLVALDPARVPTRVGSVTVSANELARFRTAVLAIEAYSVSGTPATGNPPTPVPPVTTPPATTGGSDGGGGAPSAWFLLALVVMAVLRLRRWNARSAARSISPRWSRA